MPSCKVCLEDFTLAGRRPLLLPCGHTFCRPCLILVQSSPCTNCPICRASLKGVVLHDLPINYDLMSFDDDYLAPDSSSIITDMVKRSLTLGKPARNRAAHSVILSTQANTRSASIGLQNQKGTHWSADNSHVNHRVNPRSAAQSCITPRVNLGRGAQSHASHLVPNHLSVRDTKRTSLTVSEQQQASKTFPPERSRERRQEGDAANNELLSVASGDLGLSAASGDLGLSAASGDLGLSAASGDLGMVKQLIKQGVDVNSVKHEVHGRRVLHLAAEGGHGAVVEVLLRAGAHVDARDRQGFTALHLASWAGHSSVVNLLLRYKADGQTMAQGRGAFHWGAIGGHVPVLRELDTHGNLNRRSVTSDHQTTLHLAADHGNMDAVQWLVEHGVGLHVKDEAGRTAEDFARDKGHAAIVRYLHRQVLLQQRKLRESAGEGVLLVVQELVTNLVDVECRSQQEGEMGRRPLHVAAERGHLDVVKVLLDAGASPDTPDDQGNTAIHYAASGGQVEVLNLLKEKGSNCFVRNQDNQTPLHSAGAAGHLEAMIWLLEQGVSPFLVSSAGDTHEDLARKNGHQSTIAVLRHYY